MITTLGFIVSIIIFYKLWGIVRQRMKVKNGAICLNSMPNIIKRCTLIKSVKSPKIYHVPHAEVVTCKFQKDANLGGHCNVF